MPQKCRFLQTVIHVSVKILNVKFWISRRFYEIVIYDLNLGFVTNFLFLVDESISICLLIFWLLRSWKIANYGSQTMTASNRGQGSEVKWSVLVPQCARIYYYRWLLILNPALWQSSGYILFYFNFDNIHTYNGPCYHHKYLLWSHFLLFHMPYHFNFNHMTCGCGLHGKTRNGSNTSWICDTYFISTTHTCQKTYRIYSRSLIWNMKCIQLYYDYLFWHRELLIQ